MQRIGAVLLLVVLLPVASAQGGAKRDAVFPMAEGFDDTLLIVSGDVDLDADQVTTSAAYFRTSGVQLRGLTKVCWTVALSIDERLDCADGALTIQVPAGSSFGFKSATPYSTSIRAAHAITTFVDLGHAAGFDDLPVGESAIVSMVDGRVSFGPIPAFPAGAAGGFTTLEEGSLAHVRGPGGVLLHTMRSDEPPMLIEGRPRIDAFTAQVAVVPFSDGAQATFRPAKEAVAADGLSEGRLDLLEEVLRDVQLIDASAKGLPFAILRKADAILSEIFNGAYIRSSLAEDPDSLSDVGFAKFDKVEVSNDRSDLTFDGSYTLVAGDLGPSFDTSGVNKGGGLSLLWWVVILFVMAAIAVGAWLWVRDGPLTATETAPQHWFARAASAVGGVALFFVWDWQLNRVLGSSILTTNGSGSGYAGLFLLEITTMLLAGLLIGVPVYLAVRYGLALAHKPQYLSLSVTAAIFLTMGLGLLLLPALVALMLNVVG